MLHAQNPDGTLTKKSQNANALHLFLRCHRGYPNLISSTKPNNPLLLLRNCRLVADFSNFLYNSFLLKSWLREIRIRLYGVAYKSAFKLAVSGLWNFTDPPVEALFHLYAVRRPVWPPLPVDQQLRRHRQPQLIFRVHHYTVDHVTHNCSILNFHDFRRMPPEAPRRQLNLPFNNLVRRL